MEFNEEIIKNIFGCISSVPSSTMPPPTQLCVGTSTMLPPTQFHGGLPCDCRVCIKGESSHCTGPEGGKEIVTCPECKGAGLLSVYINKPCIDCLCKPNGRCGCKGCKEVICKKCSGYGKIRVKINIEKNGPSSSSDTIKENTKDKLMQLVNDINKRLQLASSSSDHPPSCLQNLNVNKPVPIEDTGTTRENVKEVLVYITASDCYASKQNEKMFERCCEVFHELNGYIVVHFNVSKVNFNTDKILPKAFRGKLNFYPTMILLNRKEWENIMDGSEELKNIVIYNGEYFSGSFYMKIDSKKDGTMEQWIRKNCTIVRKRFDFMEYYTDIIGLFNQDVADIEKCTNFISKMEKFYSELESKNDMDLYFAYIYILTKMIIVFDNSLHELSKETLTMVNMIIEFCKNKRGKSTLTFEDININYISLYRYLSGVEKEPRKIGELLVDILNGIKPHCGQKTKNYIDSYSPIVKMMFNK